MSYNGRNGLSKLYTHDSSGDHARMSVRSVTMQMDIWYTCSVAGSYYRWLAQCYHTGTSNNNYFEKDGFRDGFWEGIIFCLSWCLIDVPIVLLLHHSSENYAQWRSIFSSLKRVDLISFSSISTIQERYRFFEHPLTTHVSVCYPFLNEIWVLSSAELEHNSSAEFK